MQAKQMKMLRDMTIRTTKGYTIQFKANQPTRVPAMIIEDCIEKGAAFCDEDEGYVPDMELTPQTEPLYGFERKTALFEACTKILNANDPESFTATGVPKLKLVTDSLGFDVDRKELNEAWKEVMKSKINSE